jgi:hypothetical protein
VRIANKSALLVPLLLATLLAGDAAAQAPQDPEGNDRTDAKLPALLSGKPVQAGAGDDQSRKLLKSRYNEAVDAAKECYDHFVHGRAGLDELYGSYQRVVQAGLELCDTRAKKIALLTQHVEAAAEIETIMRARQPVGRCTIGDVHRARYERLDAEIQLLRAKRAVG